MSAPRGLGYREDSWDERDYRFAIDKKNPPSGIADLRKYRGAALAQGGAGSCVAFALTRALQLLFARQGGEYLVPSPQWIYHAARRQEFAGLDPATLPPLTDSGSYPRLALTALKNVGFCPEVAWPYDWRRVNDEPPMGAIVDSFDQRGMTYYRISNNPFSETELALRLGLPVLFGIRVDAAFVAYSGEGAIHEIDSSEIIGGHMLTALAIEGNHLIFDNWWGENWGAQGLGRLDADLYNSDLVRDIWVLDSASPWANRVEAA